MWSSVIILKSLRIGPIVKVIDKSYIQCKYIVNLEGDTGNVAKDSKRK